MQTYDPDQLVREIQLLLQQQGIQAEIQPGHAKETTVAAGQLLRTLGVTPAMDAVASLARSMDKPWAENN